MKHARKALVILFLFVTPLLLSGIITSVPTGEVMVSTSITPTKVSVPSYDEQTPILAYNDFDMDNYASALSWEGNGMPDTPYIIEGYNITDDGYCIRIEDTTKAFEIRNCYISSFSGSHGTGIYIENVTQAAIVDTVILDKFWSIDILNTPAPYVENCTIHDNYLISLFNCTGAIITECDIYDNTNDGIYLYDCNSSMISNNVITGSATGEGIFVEESYYVTAIGNHISHCQSGGIVTLSSPYITIEENIIHDNSFFTGPIPMCGVHLEDSDHASIVGNEIYHNERNGIFIEWSDWAYVFDNEIYDNSDHGIDVFYSFNGTILQNDIHGNGWWPAIVNALCGIYLGAAFDFVISDNSIWNNTPSGISIMDGEIITISNNHIFNNSDTGIYAICAEPCYELEIVENEIHHNGFSVVSPNGRAGILLNRYEECLIANNLVYNNTDFGISVHGDNNRIIGNVVYNSETGIGTEECNYNLISENIVYNCLGGILLVNIGSNVTDNIVFDNEYGIYVDQGGDNRIYGNDLGWNTMNAYEARIFEGMFVLWDDNVSVGNHWHDYDGGGTYTIWNSTDATNIDRFPSISLNLTETNPIAFEILETGNILEWEAYALNPSHYEVFVDGESVLVEEWDGGNIEYNADGLAHGTRFVELKVYHISEHYLGSTTSADVEDLTPPSVIFGRGNIVLVVGDILSEQYSSEDPSGVLWFIDDTVNFAISSTGLLTNITDLVIGQYSVEITASDPYGHSTSINVQITVNAPPGGNLPTIMILVIGGGAAVVVVVVLVVMLKKKN